MTNSKRLCVVRQDADRLPGWTGDYHTLHGYLDPISGHIPELPEVGPEDEVVAYFPTSGDAWEDGMSATATAVWLAAQLDRPIRVFGLHAQPMEVDPAGRWFSVEGEAGRMSAPKMRGRPDERPAGPAANSRHEEPNKP